MAQTPEQKVGKALVDALADARYNPNALINYVTEYAEWHDEIQQNLWLTFVAYAYNRAVMYDWRGYELSPMREFVGIHCSNIVHGYMAQHFGESPRPISRPVGNDQSAEYDQWKDWNDNGVPIPDLTEFDDE